MTRLTQLERLKRHLIQIASEYDWGSDDFDHLGLGERDDALERISHLINSTFNTVTDVMTTLAHRELLKLEEDVS